MPTKKDSRLERAGVSGYNKPKRTPNHPTKSHVVVAKEGDKVKTIRFGQQGVKGAGKSPKTACGLIIDNNCSFAVGIIFYLLLNQEY
jgi:hypothetical protein